MAMLSAEELLLSPSAAGDDEFFRELRVREFSRLDHTGQVYLDYTGSALYAESQIGAHHDLLRQTVLGNPHSEHAPSRASTAVIDAARELVLRFFDVDQSTHDVCFTANASAAIKLVAESYPFSPETPLVLSQDNHNSVNGIREYARRANAPVRIIPVDGDVRLCEPERILAQEAIGSNGLFGFPAQSNATGVHHPLSLVNVAHALGYRVLLDAAAYVSAHPLSLRECGADFTVLSFYKLFGYPTGVGALVAQRAALAMLRRPWFAGGTVQYVSVQADTHRLHADHEGFEDGTPDFLSIAALPAGFALLESVGMPRLAAHVARLTEMFLEGLSSLRHRNGRAVAQINGPSDMTARGGTVSFNIHDREGRVLPYTLVERTASDAGISFRGGCFCNPGASEAALRMPLDRMLECFSELGDDFTVERFATCLDSPVGAVRASFGLANNEEDIQRALAFLQSLAS